ncbi:MAG: RNB domain-containing ribonuclease, partial [Deltaproteobacteria bacterium]|nr:RNB domain-containing ribonuclease [Deltaproteobacteria bacterium]
SVVKPDSAADIHARAQAANLYLPEQTISMLPPEATGLLGLGLHETSPALSFGITLRDNGSLDQVEVHPSRIKVERLSYARAQELLDQPPLKEIYALTQKYHEFRKAQNAVFISLPEVKIRVENGRVSIKPLPALNSREMVTDAMLMAGEAAARFALANSFPFPFVTQPQPETLENPSDLAGMFAYRRQLKPSEVRATPGPHAGLGLEAYSRATSPLRRYADLVAHQQIRAALTRQKLLDEQEMLNRIGSAAAMTGNVRKLERLSNLHWTLVYLLQNPGWRGKGVVVEKKERFDVIIIPAIGMETRLSVTQELALNEEIDLGVTGIDLPGLTARFTNKF